MAGSSWRDTDRQVGAGPRPSSVGAVVRRTHLGLSAARWGESVLIGAGALCTTLAAAAVGGAALGWLDVWIVALFAGACAAAAWKLEHRRDERAVARMLDRRLRHRGALLTAFEVEERPDVTPVGQLLRARVLARLRTREALHSIAPPLVLPLAVPLAGVALLALALEGEPRDETGLWLDPAAMAGELDGLQRQTLDAMDEGTVDKATARELNDLEHRIDQLAAALARPDEDPETLLEQVEILDRELVDLSSRIVQDPAISARLEAVRPYLDAARMGLGDGRMRADGGESGGGPETGEGGHGTIPGSSGPGADRAGAVAGGADPPGATIPAPDVGPGAEAGSIAGRWWAEEYDEIVARWIEYQRRELRGRDEPRD